MLLQIFSQENQQLIDLIQLYKVKGIIKKCDFNGSFNRSYYKAFEWIKGIKEDKRSDILVNILKGYLYLL
jgi:hypothetical protein